MPREGVQHRNPLWLKLVAAGLAGLVVVAAIIVLAPQLLQNPSLDVIFIKPDPTPFKERPKDAGGMEIPHQDTTVMGMLSNVLPQKETPERLRPPVHGRDGSRWFGAKHVPGALMCTCT